MGNLRMFEPRLFEPGLSDSIESMFRRMMSPTRLDPEAGAMDMRIDVAEVDGMYKVRADLPGVKKEEISVCIDGNQVQIATETKEQKETKDEGGRWLRNERWHGAMSRTFTLAQDVDEAKATAKYEDGVLTLELPKRPSSATKRLAIQ
jgi:HSP20 family protein